MNSNNRSFWIYNKVPISGWIDEDGEQVVSAVIVEGAPLAEKTDSKLAEKSVDFEEGLGRKREPIIGKRSAICHP